ncbi:MAG: pitrilysin family protein [Candidatus Paceibacterota bacterium]|jgi:predicted Zn-dependent peptidase
MRLKFDPFAFEYLEIDGVPVFYKKLPWCPTIHTRIILKIGAVDDPVDKEGLTHFLEHMPFEGCRIFPNRELVRKFTEKFTLDSFGAYTGHSETAFRFRTNEDNFLGVMTGIKNVIFHPLLEPSTVAGERKVIINEAWEKLGNHSVIELRKRTRKDLFLDHPSSKFDRPLGWPDTIAQITDEDISAWHKQWYHRNNLALVFVGNLNTGLVREAAKSIAINLPCGQKPTCVATPLCWPAPRSSGFTIETRKLYGATAKISEQATLQISRVIGKSSDPEILEAALEMFNRAATQAIRGKLKATYDVDAGAVDSRDHSLVRLETRIPADMVGPTKNVLAEIQSEIADRKLADLFGQVRQQLIDDEIYSEITGGQIINAATNQIVHDGTVIDLNSKIERLQKLSHEEVCSFVEKEFDPSRLYTITGLP